MICQKESINELFTYYITAGVRKPQGTTVNYLYDTFSRTTPAHDINCQKESIMFDYIEQVTDFMQANFSPGSPEVCNLKMTNAELLGFLFKTFPEDCISDYELNDIMIKLKFERITYSADVDGDIEIKSGWNMFSDVMVQEKKEKPVESE